MSNEKTEEKTEEEKAQKEKEKAQKEKVDKRIEEWNAVVRDIQKAINIQRGDNITYFGMYKFKYRLYEALDNLFEDIGSNNSPYWNEYTKRDKIVGEINDVFKQILNRKKANFYTDNDKESINNFYTDNDKESINNFLKKNLKKNYSKKAKNSVESNMRANMNAKAKVKAKVKANTDPFFNIVRKIEDLPDELNTQINLIDLKKKLIELKTQLAIDNDIDKYNNYNNGQTRYGILTDYENCIKKLDSLQIKKFNDIKNEITELLDMKDTRDIIYDKIKNLSELFNEEYEKITKYFNNDTDDIIFKSINESYGEIFEKMSHYTTKYKENHRQKPLGRIGRFLSRRKSRSNTTNKVSIVNDNLNFNIEVHKFGEGLKELDEVKLINEGYSMIHETNFDNVNNYKKYVKMVNNDLNKYNNKHNIKNTDLKNILRKCIEYFNKLSKYNLRSDNNKYRNYKATKDVLVKIHYKLLTILQSLILILHDKINTNKSTPQKTSKFKNFFRRTFKKSETSNIDISSILSKNFSKNIDISSILENSDFYTISNETKKSIQDEIFIFNKLCRQIRNLSNNTPINELIKLNTELKSNIDIIYNLIGNGFMKDTDNRIQNKYKSAFHSLNLLLNPKKK